MSDSKSEAGIVKTIAILTALVGLVAGVLTCTKEGISLKERFFPRSDTLLESKLKPEPKPPDPKPPQPNTPPTPRPIPPRPLSKLVGTWTFTMYSKVGKWTANGTLNIEDNGNNNQTGIRGHLRTFSTGAPSFSDSTEAPSFSGDVHGTFINDKLKLMRDTNEKNTIQYYDLTYYSNNRISGTYHNDGHYNDNGTFQLKR